MRQASVNVTGDQIVEVFACDRIKLTSRGFSSEWNQTVVFRRVRAVALHRARLVQAARFEGPDALAPAGKRANVVRTIAAVLEPPRGKHLNVLQHDPLAAPTGRFGAPFVSSERLVSACIPLVFLNGQLLTAVLVPRRGLEPPRPCERQHLKLVRLPIPPPGHSGSAFRQAAALKGAQPALSI
jgi:hypothetical protein